MAERGDLLRAVRSAWAETLGTGVDAVPLEEGFFEAGGNSLLLLLLWEILSELTSRELRATDLFQHPTVRAQAELLLALGGEPSSPGEEAPGLDRPPAPRP